MKKLSRREFLGVTATAAAVSMTALNSNGAVGQEASKATEYRTKLYKSISCSLENIPKQAEALAGMGYDGIETNWEGPVKVAREARAAAEANGLRVHSVLRGWTNFNVPEDHDKDIESVKTALRTARAVGADAILLVPCRTDAPAGINPWDIKIEYDPTTCLVSKISEGDNAPFADYIKKQNEATEATRRCLEECIPTAAAEGVTIALENVWNNLWVTPEFAAAFIRSLDNVWIKAYYDMGNHVKYAPTEEWFRALGKSLISKLHIKDFSLDKSKPDGGSFAGFVPIGHGTVDWVSVRNAIEEVGFSGFVTLEDVAHFTPEQHSVLLDDFIAGRPMSIK
ncbi:MAG: sugar phosphate isomerase/epimerase family protein [Planctomycetia bacterium]|nr:sugar phosphate isomerase/epimerase family protein [Planctomycetia bacterium]